MNLKRIALAIDRVRDTIAEQLAEMSAEERQAFAEELARLVEDGLAEVEEA